MSYSKIPRNFFGKQFLACFILLSALISAQEPATPLRQVRFIENKGQLTDMEGKLVPFVYFKAGAPGLDLYITNKGLTYSFFKIEENDSEKDEKSGGAVLPEVHEYEWEVVNLDLKGANILKENIVFQELQQGEHHFYTPRFPDGTTVAHEYGKITIREIYPSIDWVLYNTGAGGFKYDFILRPGSNPDNIRLCYTGLSEARLHPNGHIEINTEFGKLREDKPVSYLSDTKTHIKSSFRFISKSINRGLTTTEFGLNLEGRRPGQGAVIDPQLTWSTFFGGNSYEGTMAAEVDANGNLFTCGYGASTNFPYLNAGTYFQGTGTLSSVAFILKFSNAGVLLWSTNYWGIGIQSDLAVDNSGNVFLTGNAGSGMSVQNNSTYFQGISAGSTDAYVLKFNNTGIRIWATFFGGSNYDAGNSIATDLSGNVFLTGATSSTNFPLMNANTYFNSTYSSGAGFVSKFDNSGSLLWSTYYPGLIPNNAAVDNAGNLLITGSTYTDFATQNPGSGAYFQGTASNSSNHACLIKFTNNGTLTWATFFGGSNYDEGMSVIADKSGRAYLLGTTQSTDMPVQNAGGYYKSTYAGSGTNDIFLARFANNGALQWCTYYGTAANENISTHDNLAVDSCDNVYASFEVLSGGLPVQPACDGGYLDSQFDSTSVGMTDLYLVRFNSSTNINWATYLGGIGYDFRSSLAVDQNSRLLVTGEWAITSQTMVSNYPIVNPGAGAYCDSTKNGSDDIYVMRFNPGASTQAFGYAGPYCVSTTSVAPSTTSLGTGGTFSASPGLSVNPSSGVIYPNGSAAGVYTISYTSNNSACSCAQSTFAVKSTATVQLLAGPSMSVAGSNTPCIGQVATRTISGAQTYTWSNGFQATIFSAKIFSQTVLTVTGTAQNSCTSVYTFTIFSRGCDGLDEETLPGVKVYPNPNNGTFIVESLQPVELILTNMLGQQIRTIRVVKEQPQVEIKELPPGMYFLKATHAASGEGLKIVVD